MSKEFAKAEGVKLKLTKLQQQEIREMYVKAAKEMQNKINMLDENKNISSYLRKAYLNDLVDATKDSIKSIDNKTYGLIQNTMSNVCISVVEDCKSLLGKMGFDKYVSLSSAFSNVPNYAVDQVMSGNLYKGKWSLSKRIWSDNEQKLKEIDEIITQGLIQNKSAFDIAKDLQKYVDPRAAKPWDWGKVYPGCRKVIDYNAQRLARTMTSHAYEEAFVRTTKDNPFIEAYRWEASNSDRVCDICKERDGKIYNKDELPLDHPNGMCTFSVVTKSYSIIGKELADWVKGEGDSKLNSEIDKYCDLNGIEYKKQNPLNDWFIKAGYKNGEMPKDFTEFAHSLSHSDTTEFLKEAGGDWTNTHPYQLMEKYYNSKMSNTNNIVNSNVLSKDSLGSMKESKYKSIKTWLSKLSDEQYEIAKQLKEKSGLSWYDWYVKEIYDGDKIVHGTYKKNKVKASIASSFDSSDLISKAKETKEKEMLELEERQFAKLTEQEKSSLKEYTSDSYTKMNKYLRLAGSGMSKGQAIESSGISENLLKDIENIKEGMKKVSLEKELVLRRGTDFGDLAGILGGDFKDRYTEIESIAYDYTKNKSDIIKELNDKYSGVVGKMHGFTSTSSLYDRGFDGDVEMIFLAPEGSKAISVMSISKYGTSEGETLIDAGTTVRILKIEESEDRHMYSKFRIFCEIIN